MCDEFDVSPVSTVVGFFSWHVQLQGCSQELRGKLGLTKAEALPGEYNKEEKGQGS